MCLVDKQEMRPHLPQRVNGDVALRSDGLVVDVRERVPQRSQNRLDCVTEHGPFAKSDPDRPAASIEQLAARNRIRVVAEKGCLS